MWTIQFHHKITQALSRSYKVPRKSHVNENVHNIRQNGTQNRECERLNLHFVVITKAKYDKALTDRGYVCESYTQV
jgi:hypothetical protein